MKVFHALNLKVFPKYLLLSNVFQYFSLLQIFLLNDKAISRYLEFKFYAIKIKEFQGDTKKSSSPKLE